MTAAITDLQGIISIEPRRYFAQLNQSMDYSYIDTPVIPKNTTGTSAEEGGNSSRIILRDVQINPQIPAYVSGLLAWGRPPAPGAQASGETCLFSFGKFI